MDSTSEKWGHDLAHRAVTVRCHVPYSYFTLLLLDLAERQRKEKVLSVREGQVKFDAGSLEGFVKIKARY